MDYPRFNSDIAEEKEELIWKFNVIHLKSQAQRHENHLSVKAALDLQFIIISGTKADRETGNLAVEG